MLIFDRSGLWVNVIRENNKQTASLINKPSMRQSFAIGLEDVDELT